MGSPATPSSYNSLNHRPPQMMTGVLMKQRDFLSGWRERYFTLDIQSSKLCYYLQKYDKKPRGVRFVRGCSLRRTKGTKTSPNAFILSNPLWETSYVLASENPKAITKWISALLKASNPAILSSAVSPKHSVASNIDKQSCSRVNGKSSVLNLKTTQEKNIDTKTTFHDTHISQSKPSNTKSQIFREMAHIPEPFANIVKQSYQRFLEFIKVNSSICEWTLIRDDNIKIYTGKILGGGLKTNPHFITAMGTSIIDAPIEAIAQITYAKDISINQELNDRLKEKVTCRQLSAQAVVEYARFARIWPSAARDMVSISSWSVLPKGDIIGTALSLDPTLNTPINFDSEQQKIISERNGIVRSNLQLGGWYLEPLSKCQTRVVYAASVDLCGSIPSFIRNIICKEMPDSVGRLREIIATKSSKQKGKWTKEQLKRRMNMGHVVTINNTTNEKVGNSVTVRDNTSKSRSNPNPNTTNEKVGNSVTVRDNTSKSRSNQNSTEIFPLHGTKYETKEPKVGNENMQYFILASILIIFISAMFYFSLLYFAIQVLFICVPLTILTIHLVEYTET